MSEPIKRRSLFPVASSPEPPPPEAIAAVAARHGFPEVGAPSRAAIPLAGEQGASRRHRQPTGRDRQFTTRLRQDTLDLIYAYANERNVPIAQIIEEAMSALQLQRQRG